MSGAVVLLPVSEAAARAQVVESDVRSAIHQGSVTAINVGGRFMVNQDDLDYWATRYREDLGRAVPSPGPCPPWCILTTGHGWDGWHGARATRVHPGPDFGPDGEVSTFAAEYADADGRREAVTIALNGDHELSVREARTLGAALSAAADWVSRVESDRAWWRTAANPACVAWCEREHDASEFALAGGLTCCRTIRFSRGELVVTRVAMADERIGAEPGALELAPATVSVELDPARADIDGEYAETSFDDLSSGLTAALAEAQALLGSSG